MRKKLLAQIVLALLCVQAQSYATDKSFINYLKSVEGYRATPYYCAANKLTVGYGHRIGQEEAYKLRGGLSESQATQLLAKDIEAVKSRLMVKYGNLSERQEAMLSDYYFNIGSMAKFPRMERAILSNDISAQRREYKRFVGHKELTGRNRAFKEYFNL